MNYSVVRVPQRLHPTQAMTRSREYSYFFHMSVTCAQATMTSTISSRCRILFIATVIVIIALIFFTTFHLQAPLTSYTRGELLKQSFYTEAKQRIVSALILPGQEQGYVVALRYSGQQGSGIKALKTLQRWANTLPISMRILEPTITSSSLISELPTAVSAQVLAGPNNSRTQILFSDLFDIDNFNTDDNDCHLPQLVTLAQFHNEAPKKVVLVWMRAETKNVLHQKTELARVIWPDQGSESDSEGCLIVNTKKEWTKYVNRIPRSDYCIVKVVEAMFAFADTKIFREEEARTVVYGKWSPTEVIVVFTLWRAPWLAGGAKKNTSREECFKPSSKYFQPSKKIIEHSQRYESRYWNGTNKLAIMFRLERIVEYLHHSSTNMNIAKCLRKVIDLSQEIQSNSPFITIDLGEFGSNSWNKTASRFDLNMTFLKAKTEETLSTLSQGEWRTIKDWEEKFKQATEGMVSSAYIAALQRTLASRADCLVLVGGGHFQSIALRDYVENHPDERTQCVELVCALESITVQ